MGQLARHPILLIHWLSIILLLTSLSCHAFADIREYHLTIERQTVHLTSTPLQRIVINGTLPGPTLRFREGDEAVIHVHNKLKEDTSIHWHGLLLPGMMDGVPGLNGFQGIKPNETFSYRFPIRQSGTYWYHAHSKGQEQDGHYGSIVIEPKAEQVRELEQVQRDYVIVLSDFHTDESKEIIANLKKKSDYYVYTKRTVGDFFNAVKQRGFAAAWENTSAWGRMRMHATDLSDIQNYIFLINGKTIQQNWTALFQPGERIRLRFINAAAMSFFDVRIPGLTMIVVAADGQAIEPVEVNEFRIGVAETYDVIVVADENKAYAIVAESIDRMGFALATLAPHLNMRAPQPTPRKRFLLTMADMGMAHEGMHHPTKPQPDSVPKQNKNTHHHHHHSRHKTDGSTDIDYITGVPGSGWAQADTPEGHKALAYKDLRYAGKQTDLREPQREIIVRLGGNMERYIWTLNGKKHNEASPIQLNYGERVRLTFINETMMAHPMHLHGMFVQLENGQALDKLPNKHTVIVAPGDRYSALLTANEPGEWAFHCHLLYHMMAGMMNEIVVAQLPQDAMPANQ